MGLVLPTQMCSTHSHSICIFRHICIVLLRSLYSKSQLTGSRGKFRIYFPKYLHFIHVSADLLLLQYINSVDEEVAMCQKLVDGGVFSTPGTPMACQQPGWFRVTVAHPIPYLKTGNRD